MAKDESQKSDESMTDLHKPTSPKEIGPHNAHLVDYDNIKVRIVCLVSQKEKFSSVSSFLVRRGWELFVTDDLTAALTQITTFKPDFVVASINHSHKKISHFPQIVSKTFSVPTILISENNAAITDALMQKANATYKITGAITGTMLQRKIKQTLQDIHQVNEDGARSTVVPGPHAEGVHQRKSHDPSGTQSPNSELITGDSYGDSSTVVQSGNSSDRSGLVMNTQVKDGAIPPLASDKPNSSLLENGTSIKTEETSEREETEPSEAPAESHTESTEKLNQKFTRQKLSEPKKRSFLEKATISIANALNIGGTDNSGVLVKVSEVVVLPVGHKVHKGYFMFASQDIDRELVEFVKEFSQSLRTQSINQSEVMEIGEPFVIPSPNYNFFANTEDGLQFNLVTSYTSGEIGIKFIQDEEVWAHIVKVKNFEKYLIDAQQIVENIPLSFDIYVHLKVNEKFYKIVNQESALSTSRKIRLLEKGTNLYIDEKDIDTYRAFQAREKALLAIAKVNESESKKKTS